MSWFDTSNIVSLAKSTLKEAQKTIDKALDITDEDASEEDLKKLSVAENAGDKIVSEPSTPFASSSIWGSFTGSFFEATSPDSSTVADKPSITQQPNASKSLQESFSLIKQRSLSGSSSTKTKHQLLSRSFEQTRKCNLDTSKSIVKVKQDEILESKEDRRKRDDTSESTVKVKHDETLEGKEDKRKRESTSEKPGHKANNDNPLESKVEKENDKPKVKRPTPKGKDIENREVIEEKTDSKTDGEIFVNSPDPNIGPSNFLDPNPNRQETPLADDDSEKEKSTENTKSKPKDTHSTEEKQSLPDDSKNVNIDSKSVIIKARRTSDGDRDVCEAQSESACDNSLHGKTSTSDSTESNTRNVGENVHKTTDDQSCTGLDSKKTHDGQNLVIKPEAQKPSIAEKNTDIPSKSETCIDQDTESEQKSDIGSISTIELQTARGEIESLNSKPTQPQNIRTKSEDENSAQHEVLVKVEPSSNAESQTKPNSSNKNQTAVPNKTCEDINPCAKASLETTPNKTSDKPGIEPTSSSPPSEIILRRKAPSESEAREKHRSDRYSTGSTGGNNRLSTISADSVRLSSDGSNSVEIIVSPDSSRSLSNSSMTSPSVEIISESSGKVASRSSDSVEVLKSDEDSKEEDMIEEGEEEEGEDSYQSMSESTQTLTTAMNIMLKSSSSLETSFSDMGSSRENISLSRTLHLPLSQYPPQAESQGDSQSKTQPTQSSVQPNTQTTSQPNAQTSIQPNTQTLTQPNAQSPNQLNTKFSSETNSKFSLSRSDVSNSQPLKSTDTQSTVQVKNVSFIEETKEEDSLSHDTSRLSQGSSGLSHSSSGSSQSSSGVSQASSNSSQVTSRSNTQAETVPVPQTDSEEKGKMKTVSLPQDTQEKESLKKVSLPQDTQEKEKLKIVSLPQDTQEREIQPTPASDIPASPSLTLPDTPEREGVMDGSASTLVASSDDGTFVHIPGDSSPVSLERCELIKIGSGHTSGDDMDTNTTSSSIEIISSPYGDTSSTASRASPSKLASSSSPRTSTKLGAGASAQTHRRAPSETSSEDTEAEKLQKKISEMTEVLEARELKLLSLSRQHSDLNETNSKLKLEKDSMARMNAEFTQRLASLEKQYQQVMTEKENLRRQVEATKLVASSQRSDEDKDEIIAQLRTEGAALSRQQMLLTTSIRKLRAAEKESNRTRDSLRAELDSRTADLERLQKLVQAKEEVERSQIEAVNQLSKTNARLERDVTSLQQQLDNLTSTLIESQKELHMRTAALAELEARLESNTSSVEERLRQELEVELSVEVERREEVERSLEHLRHSVMTSEQEHTQQVEALRRENHTVLRRLEEARAQHEALAESMISAASPLTREIESLSASHARESEAWEKEERRLNETINELQARLSSLKHIERSTKESAIATSAKISALESQLESEHRDVLRLREQLQSLHEDVEKISQEKESALQARDAQVATLREELAECRRCCSGLEQRLSVQTAALESERRRTVMLQNQMQQMSPGQAVSDTRDNSTTPPGFLSHSQRSSPLSLGRPVSVTDSVFPPSDEGDHAQSSLNKSVYDSLRLGGSTSLIESLQSQVKLKDTEVTHLQWELSRRELERASLTAQVTSLTARLEECELRMRDTNELQGQYDALLQMYGEKLEECQELRLDLDDVKEMYKAQIDQLLKKDESG